MHEIFVISDILKHIMMYSKSFSDSFNLMITCKNIHEKLLNTFKEKLKLINFNKFVFGRMYQYLRDNKIPLNPKTIHKYQVVDKAHTVANNASYRDDTITDFTLLLSKKKSNYMYLGRCVQFILSSHVGMSLKGFESYSKKAIISDAHQIKTSKLVASFDNHIFDVSKLCGKKYCTCKIGCHWMSCGKCYCGKLFTLVIEKIAKNLDDDHIVVTPKLLGQSS